MSKPINRITAEDVKEFTERSSLADYQKIATRSARYPGKGMFVGLMYVGIAVGNEAGELQGEIKKALRDDGFGSDTGVTLPGGRQSMKPLTPERRQKIILEGGDLLWYLAATCDELGCTLQDMAGANLLKLFTRDAVAATGEQANGTAQTAKH